MGNLVGLGPGAKGQGVKGQWPRGQGSRVNGQGVNGQGVKGQWPRVKGQGSRVACRRGSGRLMRSAPALHKLQSTLHWAQAFSQLTILTSNVSVAGW